MGNIVQSIEMKVDGPFTFARPFTLSIVHFRPDSQNIICHVLYVTYITKDMSHVAYITDDILRGRSKVDGP